MSTSNESSLSKTIAVTGSHGLIGSHVVAILNVQGHHVIRLERPSTREKFRKEDQSNSSPNTSATITSTAWDPQHGLTNPEQLHGIDAVIHLAGKGIADRRWTAGTKSELVRSRVDATRLLAQQLSELPKPPRAFVSASGVGIYGHRGDLELDESEPASDDFLGQLAFRWEHATQSLVDRGTRVCVGRLGIVLTPNGGALAKMLPLFRCGLAGRLGSGKQYWSWIGHEDATNAFVWLALNPTCQGPYNLVAGSVSNQVFTKCLATMLKRPACLPVPGFVLRVLMGEMADGLLLNSTRASGRRILATGYPMRQIDLMQTFREMLGVQAS